MIYTVTFNPAIDYLMYVPEMKTGSILRSERESVFFGGKGINVSLILSELGIESTAMGFIAGFTGDAVERGISGDKIHTDFVRLKDGLTRINVKVRSDCETDINGHGPNIGEEDVTALLSKLKGLKSGDILVLAGSVPSTLPCDIYERIMKELCGKGVRFAVDAAGELLKESLKYRPFLIKPNCDELSELFGVPIYTPEQALKYAKKLKENGALNVLVSMGDIGAVLSDEHGIDRFIPAVKGKTVNTVGAGDSMVAGFIAGFEETGDYEYALRLGTAAGGATAFSEGLAKRESILELLDTICSR